MSTMTSASNAPVDYQTRPEIYKHWSIKFEGPVATLVMSIDEDGGLNTTIRDLDPDDWAVERALSAEHSLLAPRTARDPGVRSWLEGRRVRDAVLVPLPASSGPLRLSVGNVP